MFPRGPVRNTCIEPDSPDFCQYVQVQTYSFLSLRLCLYRDAMLRRQGSLHPCATGNVVNTTSGNRTLMPEMPEHQNE